MKKIAALILTAGFAAAATAQVPSSAPPQAMPAPYSVTPGVIQSGAVTPGTVIQSGATVPGTVLPGGTTVQNGVVTSQPYTLTPSVMGGTVVGQPGMTGTPAFQSYTGMGTGSTVVGGSYMAPGNYQSPAFNPAGTTVYGQPAMSTGAVTYGQPTYTTGTVMSAYPTNAVMSGRRYYSNGTVYGTPAYTTGGMVGSQGYSNGTYSQNGGFFGSQNNGLVGNVVGLPVQVGRGVFRTVGGVFRR